MTHRVSIYLLTVLFARKYRRYIAFLLPVIGFIVLSLLFPLPASKLHPQASLVIEDREGHLLRAFLAPDEMWRIRVPASDISSHLKKAVLAYEDQYFYWHLGINPVAIVRAAWVNLKAGDVVQGGSTLTMQIARMIEPKERTFKNKFIEVFRAFQLEFRYSKEELLDIYLNLAPYGGNVVGAGAASYLYFNKHPSQLSLGEAALLAAVPNAPTLLRPDRQGEATRKARGKILRLLVKQGRITPQRMVEAQAEPIPDHRYDLPFEIPHLSTFLAGRHPQSERLQTTIDLRIQHIAERLLRTHLAGFRGQGVTNGAIVVIENATQDVVAWVGSYDFSDTINEGQVNGVLAPRSPGSALKPFVYALGLDQGLISPQHLLHDVPVDYAGYQPVNYDGIYNGVVTVEDALIRSLNVPAVNLYADLKDQGLYIFMKEAGISTLTEDKSYYGLSLVLGGGEVRLLELTNLYAGLANKGRFRKYRLLQTDPERSGKQRLSKETAFIITEILSQLRRPDLPAVWEWSVNTPKVAWKTGTSYGHRDAWSVGYTPAYTIGVWAGNFDGKGVPALVGAEVSAPILLNLFEALEPKHEQHWFTQPEGVERRQVCAVSGMIPTSRCAATRDEWYISGISPHQPCTIHQLVELDQETGLRLCTHCRQGRVLKQKVFEQWPATVATWMARNGYPIAQMPVHYPKCSKVMAGTAPIIRSPLAGSVYKIRPEVDLAYQHILLDASVSNRTQTVYWFLNRKLIHAGPPTDRAFLKPKAGTHRLICMDDEGRSSEVSFTIE